MHFGTFDAQFFGLAVDALARSALGVQSMVRGAMAVQGDALNAAEFSVDIFDTAFAFGQLGIMLRCHATRLSEVAFGP